jgi:hypothetical protein
MSKTDIWTGRTEDYFTFSFRPKGSTESVHREVGVAELADGAYRREGLTRLIADAVAVEATHISMGIYFIESGKAYGRIFPLGPGVEFEIEDAIVNWPLAAAESEAA